MQSDQDYWGTLSRYVHPGNRVAELYHGGWGDILRGLSELVGDAGKVYGVDNLNPFSNNPPMRNLQAIHNIKLLNATIPPMPNETSNLDAVAIREFLWTYDHDGGVLRDNSKTYRSLDASLKRGGHLILPLSEGEQRQERGKQSVYQRSIAAYLPHFSKVHDEGPLMIFEKASNSASRTYVA